MERSPAAPPTDAAIAPFKPAIRGAFDGGYGLRFDGRWHTIIGRPVTYATTSPSLCVLEKLVHVEDPELLPALAMVTYEVPDDMPVGRRTVLDLPVDWRQREAETQRIGDRWLAAAEL